MIFSSYLFCKGFFMLVRILAILGLLFAAAAIATGQEAVHLDLTGVKAGDYHLKVDADGGITLVPLRIVKPGGKLPPPPPPPGNKPFEQAIQTLAQKALDGGGTKTTGAALSSVYSLVSSSVSDGSIASEKAFEAVKKASDTVIAVQPDGAKWATFRTEVGKALSALAADGSLTTKAQIAAALQSVANGMNKATGFEGSPAALATVDPSMAGILEGIDLAKLIELIKLIMELIKAFS